MRRLFKLILLDCQADMLDDLFVIEDLFVVEGKLMDENCSINGYTNNGKSFFFLAKDKDECIKFMKSYTGNKFNFWEIEFSPSYLEELRNKEKSFNAPHLYLFRVEPYPVV